MRVRERAEGCLLIATTYNPEMTEMKRLILSLTGAISLTGAAFADSVTVSVPANVNTQEGAAAYTSALDRAVSKVCRNAFSPVIGTNYFAYKACLVQTRLDVAKLEPTGLYASRFSKPASSLALAAK
jgi:hypothetical protein